MPVMIWQETIATLTNPHGAVTVTAHRCREGDRVWTRQYDLTGSSLFRASLAGCPCVLDGNRTPCPLPYGHAKTAPGRAAGCEGGAVAGFRGSNGLFCHKWHDGRVVRLARAVLAVYGTGAATPPRRRPPSGPRMRSEDIAAALGLTVEQYRAELAKARE